MRKFAIAAAGVAVTLAAPAQQLPQCLNPDILNGVVFLGRSELKMDLTRVLPPAMSGFETPDGFVLIGTGVREGGSLTTVAYKTSLAGDRAYTAMLAALAADGWAVDSGAASTSSFSVAGAPRYGIVCRNGERRIVSLADTAGVRYVNIMAYQESRSRDCNTPDPAMDPAGSFAATRAALPRFRFPEGTTLAQGGGGGGGSTDMTSASSRVVTTATVATLMEHLEGQLVAQGWWPGANWSGTVSEGSTWQRTTDGRSGWGTLEIVRAGEQTYDVDFTLTLQP